MLCSDEGVSSAHDVLPDNVLACIVSYNMLGHVLQNISAT